MLHKRECGDCGQKITYDDQAKAMQILGHFTQSSCAACVKWTKDLARKRS